MTEQLNHTHSETVHIDFSKVSVSIAQLRIQIRRTHKIVWITGWIESIPRLGLGNFDFIVCAGVLHHLKNPQKGLNIMNKAQPEHGGAALFVYGKQGRIGVYQIQKLLRIINQPYKTMDIEVRNANLILELLPETHWFRHFRGEHEIMGDVAVYDLLLNKRDVSYAVSDVYKWVKRSSYKFVDFSLPENKIAL